ncbi:LptM family lipoprotein [Sulfurospirillum multivorans]|uniref:Lipoprotein n=2 Tax=Sulfurospirillum multivorans TaxID=66821 RepID=A0AA86AIU5_SULMK|nr:hypothetical protein [Sulfurospirillum multivorans]AHJ11319.1 hypothetical protein SMUL_0031 [Sulfurospirillum multivorans DSM 12446]QEH04823.1 hypothetical protein SMN_0029 [Sulfurospirillum multivorans]
MLNIIKGLCIILSLTFLTGCGTKGLYHEDYVSKEIKPNLNKVSNTKVCLKDYANVIAVRSNSRPNVPATEIALNAGEINTNILNLFTKQYFTKVEKNCGNESIYIDSYIQSFKFDLHTFGGGEIFVLNNIKVFKDNKIILEKTYDIQADNKIVLGIFAIKDTAFDSVIELYHRALFEFYETEFKKDLIEGPFRILCQSGKITNTQGHRYEDRNRRRAICSRY